MSLSEALIAELNHESVATHKMLERIPEDSQHWKPHEKSRTIGETARHIANLPGLFIAAMGQDGVDRTQYQVPPCESVVDVVSMFDQNIKNAVNTLLLLPDDKMMQPWTYRYGEKVIFKMPRLAIIRGMGINHLIHHRGQLSVYLRMLDIPLPGVYGPTADEK
ncbi:MAG: DinB family protein [Bacteroidetes bacterium]|nr:DinB family protein [Bacteroidota bacterium]